VPDKEFTFDKDRDLTSISHLVDDHLQPSPERDFEHFRDFALKVSCRCFNVRPESEAEQFAKELWDMQYSIHYHVWTDRTFAEFLNSLVGPFPAWTMKQVASRGTVGDEFIVVLEKVG
jgi:hypothetical protein